MNEARGIKVNFSGGQVETLYFFEVPRVGDHISMYRGHLPKKVIKVTHTQSYIGPMETTITVGEVEE